MPAEVVRRTLGHVTAANAEMHTPYGATEALPVSTIDAREILGETAAATSKGAGVCVGRNFYSIEWRVIRITDGPIARIEDAEELPAGEIGELIVRGPQVSRRYMLHPVPSRGREPESFTNDANALAKVADGDTVWHRMGDVGYLDDAGRFWYCGRKSHRVETGRSSCYSAPYEEVFNAHPRVKRSALVGVGPIGDATPVLVVELVDDDPGRNSVQPDDGPFTELQQLKIAHLSQDPAQRLVEINRVLVHPGLPVDVRHNAKINREALAAWAKQQLQSPA